MAQEYIRTIILGKGRWPYTGGGLLFLDNLEGTYEWAGSGTGADYVVERSNVHAYEDDYSLRLKTRTTGAAADDVADAERYIGLVPEKKLMLCAFYRPISGTTLKHLTFEMAHYDGSSLERAAVRYVYSTKIWQYFRAGVLDYVNITDSDQNLSEDAWHSMALSVDFATNKYISLISDGLQLDLSAHDYVSGISSDKEHLRIYLWLMAAGATPAETYYDNISVSII